MLHNVASIFGHACILKAVALAGLETRPHTNEKGDSSILAHEQVSRGRLVCCCLMSEWIAPDFVWHH